MASDNSALEEAFSDDQTDGYAVYIVECSDDSFYTGYTNDLERRIREHNNGNGGSYTSARRPVTLIHTESFATQSAAMSREYEIKQFSRSQKEELVGYNS